MPSAIGSRSRPKIEAFMQRTQLDHECGWLLVMLHPKSSSSCELGSITHAPRMHAGPGKTQLLFRMHDFLTGLLSRLGRLSSNPYRLIPKRAHNSANGDTNLAWRRPAQ